MKSFCIWNNKGGVGKSFLAYILATSYADTHPDETVIVVDMCPQAKISEMLLGGNYAGAENLNSLYNKGLSVAHYIKSRYNSTRRSWTGDEAKYVVAVSKHNDNLPKNLYLVAGDSDLDMCSGLISYLSIAPEKDAWKLSRLLLNDLLDAYKSENKDKKIAVFLDCNPSFASYTELAILASDFLIIPCIAEDSSIRALGNVFTLLYGTKTAEPYNTFSKTAQSCNLTLPKIHSLVLNKSKSHDKKTSKLVKSFTARLAAKKDELYQQYPNAFLEAVSKIYNIKDANSTLATVLSHKGSLLKDIHAGEHTVYDNKVQLTKEQLLPLLQDITKLVDAL